VRRIVSAVDPIDATAALGVILVALFVGNRFGLDAAVGFIGIVLVGVAVLFAIVRGGGGDVPTG